MLVPCKGSAWWCWARGEPRGPSPLAPSNAAPPSPSPTARSPRRRPLQMPLTEGKEGKERKEGEEGEGDEVLVLALVLAQMPWHCPS